MNDNFLDKLMAEFEAEEEAKAHAEAERRGVSVEVVRKEEQMRRDAVEKAQLGEARRLEVGRRAVIDEERLRRKAYGERLGLGVAAHNGIVMVLSGLTERSMGNGTNRATVEHVVLDEDLVLGRLHRSKGDLLCKPYHRLGKRTMGISGTASWGSDDGLTETDWVEDLVTCKACLEILERLKKQKKREG